MKTTINYQSSVINRQLSIFKLCKTIYIYKYINTSRLNNKHINIYTNNTTTSPTEPPDATNAQQAYKHTRKDKSRLQGHRKPHTGRKQKGMKLYAQNIKAAQKSTSGAKRATTDNRCRLYPRRAKSEYATISNASKHAGTKIRSFFKMTISSFR